MSRLALAALASAALLSACAPMPPAPADARRRRRGRAARGRSGDWVQPNANLVVQGIPPIPASVVRAGRPLHRLPRPQLRRLASDPARDAGLAPQGRRQHGAAVPRRRADGRARAADRLRRAGAQAQLRAADRASTSCSSAATAATRPSQLYRLDLASRQVTLLTDPGQRHEHGRLAAPEQPAAGDSSVPLDRTAAGGTRPDRADADAARPGQPDGRRKLAELPGGGWFAGGVSWDDTQVALTRYLSANRVAGLAARPGHRRAHRAGAAGAGQQRQGHPPRRRLRSATTRASSSSATATASSAS